MSIDWSFIDRPEQLGQLVNLSKEVPCLIFKHSTRCSISTIAQHRLEKDWRFPKEELQPFFIDLIANRAISNTVADFFSVSHESPQVLLIHEGECIYDASHLDIQIDELQECLTRLNV